MALAKEDARKGMDVVVTGDTAMLSHRFDRGTRGEIRMVNANGRSAQVKGEDGRSWWVGLADLKPDVVELACRCGCGVK